jgi:hypothetical protein
VEQKYAPVIAALEKRGIKACFTKDRKDAKEELLRRIPPGSKVGIGGSQTIEQLDVVDELAAAGSEVIWHWRVPKDEVAKIRREALGADVYLASSNALTEDGHIVNIDGTANRIAGMVFGPPRVILVVGINKLAADLEAAIFRARNEAAVINAQRLEIKAPCYYSGKCEEDCDSPLRICRVLQIIEYKPSAVDIELILVGEELGY